MNPQQISEFLQISGQGYALFDNTDTLVYGNAAFRQFLQLGPEEYPTWTNLLRICHTRKTGTHIHTDDIETWIASARSRRGKVVFRQFESDMYNGTWLNITETTMDNGWMFCVFTDVTHLSVNNHELRYQRDRAWRASMTDELTGLSNRRYMMDMLKHSFDLEYEQPISIALLDLDLFKRINDRHGHDAGDKVLKDFARKMLDAARREDVACRMGGEEFLFLFRRTDLKSACQVIDRLAHAVKADAVQRDFDFPYSFSAGLTEMQPDDSIASLLKRADEALYRAKAEGRDRYRVA